MAIPWWVMPGVLFGASTFVKAQAGKGKFRWLELSEPEVRGMSIFSVVTKASTGDELPPPREGYVWKPIHLTFSPGPLSAPALYTIHVMEPAQAGVAGFLTVQHLMGLGRRPRHHRPRYRGPTVIYDSGPIYPYPYIPLYAEDISTVISPTETWTVEWVADGKKQQQVFRTELEARRLKDALAASRIAANITRGGVI